MADASVTRRAALGSIVTASVAVTAAITLREPFKQAMRRWNQKIESRLFDPDVGAADLPAGSETPPADFPTYFISPAMPVAPEHWRLAVGGMVARPAALSLADLQRLPRTDMRVRHHCVEGWSAVAAWHGVRLSDLAAMVGADPRASFVEFRSFDMDYWSSWDRASAFHRQTILAYGMNGETLGPGHGAPLRLYSATKLGYKMVKYLTAVNFIAAPTGGYWEDQGYEWFAGV